MLYNDKTEEETYDSNKQNASLASYDSATGNAWKVIGGFRRPFHIHITCDRAFLTEYGTKYVHILNLHGTKACEVLHSKWKSNRIFCKRE